MDLAAEQGHNSTLKHGVGRTLLPLSVVPYPKRALAQPRGRSPLDAGRWDGVTQQRSASQQRSSAEAPDAQTRSTGISGHPHGAAPSADLPRASEAQTRVGPSGPLRLPVSRGFGEFGSQLGQRSGLQASGRNGTSPPIPRVWFQDSGRHMVAQPEGPPGRFVTFRTTCVCPSEGSTSRAGSIPDLLRCSSGLSRARSPAVARTLPNKVVSSSFPSRAVLCFPRRTRMHGPPAFF